jgi:hypothetical protein
MNRCRTGTLIVAWDAINCSVVDQALPDVIVSVCVATVLVITEGLDFTCCSCCCCKQCAQTSGFFVVRLVWKVSPCEVVATLLTVDNSFMSWQPHELQTPVDAMYLLLISKLL